MAKEERGSRNITGNLVVSGTITQGSDQVLDQGDWGAAGYPVDVDATEADGSATTVARSDHRHKYASASITDTHVAAANKDGAAGTASMRTLGASTSGGAAAPGGLGFTAVGQVATCVDFGGLARGSFPVGIEGRVLRCEADSDSTWGLGWAGGWSDAWIEMSRRDGVLAETFPRAASNFQTSSAPLSSGRLHMCAIYLFKSTLITSITFWSGGTALATGTHQWFALYDSSRALLRQTSNDTSTAWGTNAKKTLNLTSTFTTTYSGLHYVGIMVAASTVPSLMCAGGTTVANERSETPRLHGSSNTGLTSTAPNPANAITNQNFMPWAEVS